jgi:hypothetical protein
VTRFTEPAAIESGKSAWIKRNGDARHIVVQADVALHAPAAQVAVMMKEISKSPKPNQNIYFEKDYFYCGQTHEQDEILLLNRRRELHKEAEAVR